MTLIKQLATDLTTWMDAATDGIPRQVMLWLDPEGEFSRLIPLATPLLEADGVDVVRFAPDEGMGQVALKLESIKREAASERRTIVYLPGFNSADMQPKPDAGGPKLWGLYEYRYKGAIWAIGERWQSGDLPEAPRLATWLYANGVRYTGSTAPQKLIEGGSDSLLARYAERLYDRPLSDWPERLRISDVQNELAGDARDRLARLLIAPDNEVRTWDDPLLIVQRLLEEYGFSFAETERDPAKLADTAAIDLAITDAWDALGRSDDFPFTGRLPDSSDQRDRQLNFLRDHVMGHAALQPKFLQRITRLESSFDISNYAAGAQSNSIPCGFPHLARAQWRSFLEAFDDAVNTGTPEVQQLLESRSREIHSGCDSPLDKVDDGSNWAAVQLLVEMDRAVASARQQIDAIGDVAALVRHYTDEWWMIDRQHRTLISMVSARPELRGIRKTGTQIYYDWAQTANERFTRFVEAEPTWPPASLKDLTGTPAKLWEAGKGNKAILICDSLRWDLACQLREGMSGELKQRSGISSLPSITPVGMTAMLPLDGQVPEVTFPTSGAPEIALDGKYRLHHLDDRKRLIKQSITTRNPDATVEFLTLDTLLSSDEVPNASILVVFDTTIDQQGHLSAEGICGVADELIEHVRRGVRRLHEANFSTVHILTDHGFLLLPPEAVHEKGTYDLGTEQYHYRSERWAALKKDALAEGLVTFPLPLAPEAGVIGFPRGVQAFTKPSGYMHGGISLQECVIPYLESHASVIEPARLEAELQVSTSELTMGTIFAVLRAMTSGGQQSLSQPEPIKVSVWAELAGSNQKVTETSVYQLSDKNPEHAFGLFLPEGVKLSAGTELTLKAVEQGTQRELDRVTLMMKVDWE
jgi:hypothetical protein